MFETFTTRARKAIVEAEAAATERGDNYIGTEHLLLGLLREGTGLAAVVLGERSVTLEAAHQKYEELAGPKPATISPDRALAAIGIDLSHVRARLEASFGPGALIDPSVRPPFTPRAKEAVEQAVVEAERVRQRYVGTEHELLGVAHHREGLAAKILGELGVDLDDLVEDLRQRVAPEEHRVRQLLTQRHGLDRRVVDAPEDRRDEVLDVLRDLGEQLQAAFHQDYEETRASARRLSESIEAILSEHERRLDALLPPT